MVVGGWWLRVSEGEKLHGSFTLCGALDELDFGLVHYPVYQINIH